MRVLTPGQSRIRRGPLGVRTVTAGCAPSAYEAWGRVDARGRYFQMDLARRLAAGRLSELVGPMAVQVDRAQRRFPLSATADAAYARLPADQRDLLDAYARGVNAARRRRPWPVEYALLRVAPRPWRPADSLLVMLSMYQQLALDEDGERTRQVLDATLPPAVAAFLRPRGDEYAAEPDFGAPVPVDELARVLTESADLPSRPVVDLAPTGASNCWAVGPSRTRDGRAILANDMHLGLGVPNVFHRVDVTYPGGRGAGFAVPGMPLVICGSNGRVAWGLANVPGDCTRLVPVGPDEPTTERTEVIGVRGAEPVRAVFRDTADGTVIDDPLLGREVATQWAALFPDGLNLAWSAMLAAGSVDEAVDVAHRHAGPPLAIVVVDADGHLAQTVAGRFHTRSAERLHDETVPPARLPLFRDPPSGFAVWTNDPPALDAGMDEVGANYPASYRRHRLAEVLTGRDDWDEAGLFALQRDSRGGFYDFYRDLAAGYVDALDPGPRAEVRAVIDGWDGDNGPDSVGPALFAEFRRYLQEELLARILRTCAAADERFTYAWRSPEPVLRRLLGERPAALGEHFGGWDTFIAGQLGRVAADLRAAHGPLDGLRWRDFLTIPMNHPMGGTRLTRWLNLPPLVPDGGFESVAAFGPGRGPVQRLVVSPGAEPSALVQMPGGQSGSPLSPHYRDHHRRWRRTVPAALRPSGGW